MEIANFIYNGIMIRIGVAGLLQLLQLMNT